jgi:hypothetical protein
MGKPKPDDVVKEVGANLESWYKKNGKRMKLLDDLTLDCDLCKSKDAKEALQKLKDQEAKVLKVDLEKFGKDSKKVIETLEKQEQKDIGKKVEKMINDLTEIINKDKVKVRVKPTYKDGVPGIAIEGDF